ncbi:hypothetical protein BMS3Abin04_02547 [bacterium BMS3Abin04]|nr:hypothetical protein BMS3Abin04_02547 [bacterium BMS3Abin04]
MSWKLEFESADYIISCIEFEKIFKMNNLQYFLLVLFGVINEREKFYTVKGFPEF